MSLLCPLSGTMYTCLNREAKPQSRPSSCRKMIFNFRVFFSFFSLLSSGLLDSFPARSSEAAAGAIRNAPWFTFLSAAQFRPTYTLFLCYPYQVVLYLPAFPFVTSITQIRYQDLFINHGKNLYFIPVVIYQTIPSSTGP